MRPSGTWSDPIVADILVMVDDNDTLSHGQNALDSYDCAPNTGEYGPEISIGLRRHRGKGCVRGWGWVDDIHLLHNPRLATARSVDVDRAHTDLFVEDLDAENIGGRT